MTLNILAFAVPLFIVLMLLEFFYAKRNNLSFFNMHNSVANVSVGILERLLDVLTVGIFYFFYSYIHTHFAIFEIKNTVLLWILLLIVTDFIWYWYHRLAHEWNILWAAHVVHHQSEDFNYTVSARITIFQAVIRTGFWGVLPLLGFPPEMISSILLVHGLYPFFIHTRTIGNLGILEYVLVTPSHHRVHHASNEAYLDKNYGDVLIIWDKLFGTFQKEVKDQHIVYGLTKPLDSYSFLWQHFHFWIELWLACKKEKGFNKIKLLFARPEKIDPDLREKAEAIFRIRKKNIELDKPLNKYVIWQMAVSLCLLFCFILFEHYLNFQAELIVSGLIIITLINAGAIMEQKQWIFYLEFSRLILFFGGLMVVFPNTWFVITVLLSLAVLAYFIKHIKMYYLRLVYPS